MSNQFAIHDIHDIRYDNYEKTKHMTHEQLLEHTKKEAAEGLEILRKMHNSKKPA